MNLYRYWRNTYQEYGDFTVQGLPYTEIRQTLPEHIQAITKSSRRIGKLVQDLKSLSRDTSELSWTEVDLNSVVETSVDLCRNFMDGATDTIEIHTIDTLPEVHGNPQQLEQVCINLLQNAAQAIQDRTGRIIISTEADLQKQSILLTVRDDGVGIPPEKLKMIFDPFYTTKRESGGTGLGLSISRSIIRNHGGDISFESTEGRGTTVLVTLPFTTNSMKGEPHGKNALS